MKKALYFFIIQFLLLSIFFLNIEVEGFVFSISETFRYSMIAIILIGVIIITFGIIGLAEPSSSFPSNTSKKRKTMFGLGIYKYIRNPIYSGIFIVFLASSAIMGSGLNLVVTLILGLSFYLKSRIEEERLVKEYSNYKTYKNSVGRFFPKIKKK